VEQEQSSKEPAQAGFFVVFCRILTGNKHVLCADEIPFCGTVLSGLKVGAIDSSPRKKLSAGLVGNTSSAAWSDGYAKLMRLYKIQTH
jgi:hypothetical protein